MAMEHFLLAAEYCTLLALSTYHQSFLLLHAVHILNPVSLAEPAASQNHPQKTNVVSSDMLLPIHLETAEL
ncbi:uncharacterized protein FPRO_11921 [Fusarium proliferatum ET1]|uniref:Uncharacterized protein n=1 Tax=Fusarium proliferatum (strain ET1) TaxID=1227346 RepID=A0A1L7W1Y1_FUSPR|nr:uncharacterized protein FPRO_11921 [Fusarium proliferatum ET1]CZR46472.1 uncharacterized protein FPRO_11921 [Fusarium proliferatum ET1]